MAPSAVILDGAEWAGVDDVDVTGVGWLWRWGGGFFEGFYFFEADFIAGLEEGGVLAVGIEEGLAGVAEDVPAALGGEGVDACLVCGDGDGACGDFPWAGVAWEVELWGESLEVGEAGGEADGGDGVFGVAVEGDDF